MSVCSSDKNSRYRFDRQSTVIITAKNVCVRSWREPDIALVGLQCRLDGVIVYGKAMMIKRYVRLESDIGRGE